MDPAGRISADGDVLNEVARHIDAIRDDSPRQLPSPPPIPDDELARAGRDAADTLRLSLTALRADLDTLAAGVRQTVALWEEHERATVAVLDEVDASLPGSGTPTGESR